MTDRESKLIERLMQGDMEAYDELMPNARPDDRAMFKDAMKKAKEYGVQGPVSKAWLVFILCIIRRNIDTYHTESAKDNQRFADAWDRCIDNIVTKQDKNNEHP